METKEYIEYFEDELKIEIKPEDDDFELSQNRKYSEYFEEDVKEEIVEENNLDTILVKHVCNICSKSYKTKGNLAQHIKSVHKGLKYPCDQCQHSAATKAALKRHTCSMHEGIKYPNPCSQCDKQFTNQASLKTHHESVHKKIRYPIKFFHVLSSPILSSLVLSFELLSH